jgi:hypothetical protein
MPGFLGQGHRRCDWRNNMNGEVYGHDFEDGQRNGWENGPGSPKGELKTEEGINGPNTYWSGQLETPVGPISSMPHFKTSLYKVLNFPTPERERAQFEITFKYRVHEPEPGEATLISFTIAARLPLQGYVRYHIDSNTPLDTWIQLPPLKLDLHGDDSQIVIGALDGTEPSVFRKLDIDDIVVKRIF